MDLNKLKDYYKRTEVENIYWEIFKETSEYKNYLLGFAQGMCIAYRVINRFKDSVNNNETFLNAIKNIVGQDEKVGEYFNRLIEEQDKI